MVNTHNPAPALKKGLRSNVPTVRFTALLSLPFVSSSHPYGNNDESSIGALLLVVLLLLIPLNIDVNISLLLLLSLLLTSRSGIVLLLC